MKKIVLVLIIFLFLSGCILNYGYVISEKMRDRRIAHAIDAGKFAKAELLIKDYKYKAEEIAAEPPPEPAEAEAVDVRDTAEYYRSKYKDWMKMLNRYMSMKMSAG
jgi:hypothetical protein